MRIAHELIEAAGPMRRLIVDSGLQCQPPSLRGASRRHHHSGRRYANFPFAMMRGTIVTRLRSKAAFYVSRTFGIWPHATISSRTISCRPSSSRAPSLSGSERPGQFRRPPKAMSAQQAESGWQRPKELPKISLASIHAGTALFYSLWLCYFKIQLKRHATTLP
jgi:hypothetical protein